MKALDFLAPSAYPWFASDLPSTRVSWARAGIYYTPGRMDEMLAAVIKLLEDASAYDRALPGGPVRPGRWIGSSARRILDFSEALMVTVICWWP